MNPQHGALAAAGRADEHTDFARCKREFDAGKHVVPLAGRVLETLAGDIDLKLHGAATAIRASQTAAPERSR